MSDEQGKGDGPMRPWLAYWRGRGRGVAEEFTRRGLATSQFLVGFLMGLHYLLVPLAALAALLLAGAYGAWIQFAPWLRGEPQRTVLDKGLLALAAIGAVALSNWILEHSKARLARIGKHEERKTAVVEEFSSAITRLQLGVGDFVVQREVELRRQSGGNEEAARYDIEGDGRTPVLAREVLSRTEALAYNVSSLSLWFGTGASPAAAAVLRYQRAASALLTATSATALAAAHRRTVETGQDIMNALHELVRRRVEPG